MRDWEISRSRISTCQRYDFLISLTYILGKLWTTAKWIRHFIDTHPEYKHDSAISMHVNYDLVRAVEKITNGKEREIGLGVELLGNYGLESGYSTPNFGKDITLESPNVNGIKLE